MRGTDVRALRERLGWRASDLGRFLHTHSVTVHRWESQGDEELDKLGHLTRRLLDILDKTTADPEAEGAPDVDEVTRLVVNGDPLRALHHVLGAHFRAAA